MARTAKARRDYGAGSVFQKCEAKAGCPPLVDGPPHPKTGEPTKVRPAHKCRGRWLGTVEAGWTENDTRRRVTVTASTEAQAKVRLRKKIGELEAGDVGLNPRTTIKAWADEWLPIVERTLAPKTYSTDASSVRKWIVPTIGHRRFDQLAPADVRKVADAQRKKGRLSSTQLRTHSVLMTLLKAAAAEGYTVPARVLAVKPPVKNASDRTDIPVEDAVKMLAAAAESPWGSRWVAALLQGMRQGESLGLTWPEINLERGLLVISWQLQALSYRVKRDRSSGFRVPDGHEARQVRGRWHLVRPKSDTSWRVIPLVPWMVSAFEAWKESAPESPHGLVWYHPVGDAFKLDDAAWYALQDAAGVRHPTGRHYTIHEARHTTATLLLEAGIDPAVIQAILGHSSIVTSRGYMHINTAPLAAAMEKVAERLALSPAQSS